MFFMPNSALKSDYLLFDTHCIVSVKCVYQSYIKTHGLKLPKIVSDSTLIWFIVNKVEVECRKADASIYVLDVGIAASSKWIFSKQTLRTLNSQKNMV
jgi:hypothetical protein